MSAPEVICDMCHQLVDPQVQYIVNIEVFASPEPVELTTEMLEQTDYRQQIQQLLESMKDVPAHELQDGVFRRFSFRLCPRCQRRYLENPLPSD